MKRFAYNQDKFFESATRYHIFFFYKTRAKIGDMIYLIKNTLIASQLDSERVKNSNIEASKNICLQFVYQFRLITHPNTMYIGQQFLHKHLKIYRCVPYNTDAISSRSNSTEDILVSRVTVCAFKDIQIFFHKDMFKNEWPDLILFAHSKMHLIKINV